VTKDGKIKGETKDKPIKGGGQTQAYKSHVNACFNSARKQVQHFQSLRAGGPPSVPHSAINPQLAKKFFVFHAT
jgi:hypothetical protein